MKDAAGAAIGAIGGWAGADKSLSQLRDELAADLREQGRRLLVIIDDVVRLPVSEVRQIFRLVKSVADLPNVIYLLIFDREIAERAFDDPGNDLGPKWHEKIVQAAFDLPPVQRIDIQQLFLEGLNKLAAGMELPDQTRWGNVFHDGIAPWLRTPRNSGRLLNALVVSWPAVARDVDFADFVALETLRLFEPSLHAFIRHNPQRLTGLAGDREYTNGERESLGRESRYRRTYGPRRAKAASAAVPKLERVWGNHGYASGFLPRWDRERRVCVEKRFPAYFGFGIGGDVLCATSLRVSPRTLPTPTLCVRRSRNTRVLFAEAVGPRRRFCSRNSLRTSISLRPVLSIRPSPIFSIQPTCSLTPMMRGAWDPWYPGTWRFWFLIKPLLERLELPDRAAALRTTFASAASLQGLCFALAVFRTSLGRDPDTKSDAAGAPLVDDATCDELEEALRLRFGPPPPTGPSRRLWPHRKSSPVGETRRRRRGQGLDRSRARGRRSYHPSCQGRHRDHAIPCRG